MAVFGFFRRRPLISGVEELAGFIDEQSAYLVQRYIYDYTNARAGPYSASLLKQEDFREAVERSRWSAFPLGLAMVGEMVEGVLQSRAEGERRDILDPLGAIVLAIFDRYEVPAAIGPAAWHRAREELARKLEQLSLHPPKRVTDIPEPYVERYFELMPFDRELLTQDVPTTRSYLRLTLINIRDELMKRMDVADMARRLRAG